MKPDRSLYYAIGVLILLAVVGYLLASTGWDNVMQVLLATETP